MKKIITKKDVKDRFGMTIPKGTELYIITELKNPFTQKDEIIAYVDNGTEDKTLMPKTFVEKSLVMGG